MNSDLVSFRQLVRFAIGGGWGTDHPTVQNDTRVLVVRGTDFGRTRSGRFDGVPCRHETARRVAKRALQPGDLLLEISGGSATSGQPTGRSLLFTRELATIADTAVIPASFCRRIQLEDQIVNPRYALYLLQDMWVSGRARLYENQSTGIANFQFEYFLDEEVVWLPSLHEQDRVLTVLGGLDDKIESNRGCTALLEQVAQAEFQARFVDFVGADEFIGSELGPLPIGWTVRSFGELGEIRGGGTPKSSEPTYWSPKEIIWVTPTDMSALHGPLVLSSARKISRMGLERSSARLLPAGTVLYTSRATIGLTAIARVELATNQGFISITPSPEFSAEFVLFAVRSAHDEVMRRANGATFLEINKTNFKAIRFPCPPMNERAHLAHLLAHLFRQIEALTREHETLTRVRDALLPKLVSGQIRVPDTADPEEVVGPVAEEAAA